MELLKNKKEERLKFRKHSDKILEPEEVDDIDLFFKTMAATVKKFEPEDRTEVKMKIFSIVTEMEIHSQKVKRTRMSPTFLAHFQ